MSELPELKKQMSSEIERLARIIARVHREVEELKDPNRLGDPVRLQTRCQKKMGYLNQLRMEMVQLVCFNVKPPSLTFPTPLAI